MPSWRWVDELQEVLRELGGRAHLNDIEKRIRERGRKPLGNNNTLRSTISSYLQYYSADSTTYWGKGDFFHLVEKGTGIWELRQIAQQALEQAEEEYAEGRRRMRLHKTKERNGKAPRRKKLRVLQDTGRLICEACEFDFLESYGLLGEGFAECHHRTPLSELEEGHKTRLSDLAIVCANCHRILHRRKLTLSVEELRNIVMKRRAERAKAEQGAPADRPRD